jgi:outer membrane protein OmpA-like peptidoglycan-associated protein
MLDNPTIVVEISAHTDCKGSAKKNMKLTECYGSVVKNYLIGKGIEPGRLVIKAYGETQLVNRCKNGVKCLDEEHAANRFVEFRVIRNDWQGSK